MLKRERLEAESLRLRLTDRVIFRGYLGEDELERGLAQR
jgi:hypothetical protein